MQQTVSHWAQLVGVPTALLLLVIGPLDAQATAFADANAPEKPARQVLPRTNTSHASDPSQIARDVLPSAQEIACVR